MKKQSILATIGVLATLLTAPCGEAAIWNVAEQGNHQPGDDIAETWQRGLNTQQEHGLDVVIPHGWWTLSKSVKTPYRSGCTIVGAGIGSPIGPTVETEFRKPLTGKRTRIVWTGKPGEPMLIATGANLEIKGGLCLHGKPWGTDQEPAGVGILFTKDGNRGLGTGKSRFGPLLCCDLPTGIQCGANAVDHNCDLLQFDWLEFRRCGIGYHGVNSQGMTTHIGMVFGHDTPKTFLYQGGGMLHVENSVSFASTLLTIRANDPLQYTSGNSNGYFLFRNTKIDAQAGGQFMALDVEYPTQIHAVFDGGVLSNPQFSELGGVFARLKGRSAMTVRDFTGDLGKIEGAKIKKRGTIRLPNVLLERCRLWCDPRTIFQGELNSRVRDCFDATGEWIEEEE